MEGVLEFLHKVGYLKSLKRAGWVREGIPNPETVASHSFRTVVMAMVLAKKAGLDEDKCIKLMIVHDLAESIVGDITPFDGISEKQKHEIETRAMKELAAMADDSEILALWGEYEERKTEEARFAYSIDKLEALLQSYEYAREHGVSLDRFWKSLESKIQFKPLREICSLLLKKR